MPPILIIPALYFIGLIILGVLGRLYAKESSPKAFYLAGGSLPFFVLFMTLYATQYSGITFVGLSAQAHRTGYTSLGFVAFMIPIIYSYFIFAPKLYRLAKKHNFITPSDFFRFRFQSKRIVIINSVIFIVALVNYIILNLKASGLLINKMSDGKVPFVYAVIGIALFVVFYETLGGMRSVAWSDVLQGIIMLTCGVTLLLYLLFGVGGFSQVGTWIATNRPELWAHPGTTSIFRWLSMLFLVGIGLPLYPQAIQRIFAAKNSLSLKRSCQAMIVMPFLTTMVMVLLGIMSLMYFPNLPKADVDGVVFLMLKHFIEQWPVLQWFFAFFLCAVLAAIMSTVDSALLSISSIITLDIFPKASKKKQVIVGKTMSFGLMAMMVVIAILLPQTIWRLLELNFEIALQIAPALYLGLFMPKVREQSIFLGIVSGLVTAIGMWTFHFQPLMIHAGIWGLLVNMGVVWFFQFRHRFDIQHTTPVKKHSTNAATHSDTTRVIEHVL